MKDLKFDQNGLIPAVIQDAESGRVLMLAYMNALSLEKTMETGQTWFYSRSRQQLWHKGETSGHVQDVVDMAYDCDGDALLIRVRQKGPACHTGEPSCFHNVLMDKEEQKEANPGLFLTELETIIAGRKALRPPGSYVAGLFEKGTDRILKKVGEEAAEVIIAAKNDNRGELVHEAADLVFHLLVTLAEKNVPLADISAELARRHSLKTERSHD